MLSYCVKSRKKLKIRIQISKIKNNRIIMQSKCDVCGVTKPRFVKEQEESRTLRSLGLKTPLSKIPLYGDVLF